MSQSVTIKSTAIRAEVIEAVRMIGKVVTYAGEQFKIYSVEGLDFYAFSPEADNTITLDFFDTHGWRRDTYAFLLPMGCKIGEGYGFEVPLSQVKRGVTLQKAHI